MAITLLFKDESAQGVWQVDYDTAGHTVGHTCTTTDPNAHLTITVTQIDTATGVPTGLTITKDVTADLNQGRVVDFSGIPPGQVPTHVKGQFYPFLFAGTWIP